MQFYARFRDEVIASPELIAAHVAEAREQVSDAFRHIFDEELVEAHEKLVAAPGRPRGEGPVRDDLPPDPREHARADVVPVHHRLPRRAGACFPDSSTATRRSTTTRPATSATASGSCARRFATIPSRPTRSVRRCATSCPRSPRRSAAPTTSGPDIERLGVSTDEVRQFALDGLTRRLGIIGVPIETL